MTARRTSRKPGPRNRLGDSFSSDRVRSRLALQKSVQNPSKSDHFCGSQFITGCSTGTYNFKAVKCTDFLGAATRRSRSPLPRGEGQGEGQTGTLSWSGRVRHPQLANPTVPDRERQCVLLDKM